jgi:hypothetical protein
MSDDGSVLPQAEIDALFKQATGKNLVSSQEKKSPSEGAVGTVPPPAPKTATPPAPKPLRRPRPNLRFRLLNPHPGRYPHRLRHLHLRRCLRLRRNLRRRQF